MDIKKFHPGEPGYILNTRMRYRRDQHGKEIPLEPEEVSVSAVGRVYVRAKNRYGREVGRFEDMEGDWKPYLRDAEDPDILLFPSLEEVSNWIEKDGILKRLRVLFGSVTDASLSLDQLRRIEEIVKEGNDD